MGQSTKKGAKKAAEAAAEPPAPDPRLEVLAGYPLHLWIADYTTRKGGCEADYSIEEWREYLVPKMDEWVARGESPERLTSARNRAERAPPSPVLISDKELSTISEQTEARRPRPCSVPSPACFCFQAATLRAPLMLVCARVRVRRTYRLRSSCPSALASSRGAPSTPSMSPRSGT